MSPARLTICLASAISAIVAATSSLHADDKLAAQLVKQSGISGGFIVHLGMGDGQLTQALRVNQRFQVHGLDRDQNKVDTARAFIQKNKKYGANISVDRLDEEFLPYIDNLVNLIIVSDQSGVAQDEIDRALTPNGVALVKTADGWTKRTKPVPKDIDDWTHFLHDASGNAVAHDDQVGPPKHLQWLGSPRWSRHHDRMASMSALVSAAGRLFYIMDEGSRVSIQLPPRWTLVSRDAFNGTILWKQPIAKWHSHLWPLKSGPTQLARRLVATEDTVFVTLGLEAPLTAIDSRTGEIKRTYTETKSTEEILHDNGDLFLLVNKGESDLAKYVPLNPITGDQGDVNKRWRWNEKPRIVMAVNAESGKTLWSKQSRVSPLTLCSDSKRVFFHDGKKVVAIDRKTGDVKWSSQPGARRRTVTYNFGPRLVIYKGVLVYAGGERVMKAFDVETGKKLWEAPHDRSGYQSPEDLLITNDLVWSAPTTNTKDSGTFTGRSVFTGEIKVTFPSNVETYWFHHRCYIAKATDKFLLPSRTGIEFVSPDQKDWDIHHWVRGGCLYGIMPCNGLVYAPPHNCACYPEAKLYGFNALAPASVTRAPPKDVDEESRLIKGPAFGEAPPAPAGNGDWPMFRHDEARSGHATTEVPSDLGKTWEQDLGGKLTSVVVANGRLYVSNVDNHTVYALDENTGKIVWQFTTGSKVDSPPSVEDGRVYFGSNDGWVYCVRATDGELIWRYRAAPQDRRLMAFEQLESVWPVHGSVLVQNGTVFTVSGRSNYLDGGLRFIKLDAASGSKLAETIIDDRDPETGKDLQERLQVLQMPVGLPDILSSDGESIYMRSQRMDKEGKRLEIGPNSGDFAGQAAVQGGKHAHLFAPMGFLDDTWFHRSYWVYGKSFAGGHAGYYQAGRFAPSGRLLVFDQDNVYGFGRKPETLKWTTVLEHQLFSAPREAPVVPDSAKTRRRGQTAGASSIRIQVGPKIDPSKKAILVEAWVNSKNPKGTVVAHGGPENGYALYLQAGRPRFALRVAKTLVEVKSNEPVGGKWVHLAGAVTSDNEVRLYVNGELAGKAKCEGLIPTAPLQGIEIGSDEGSAVANYVSPNGFTGVIDEVSILHGSFSAKDLDARFDDPDLKWDVADKPVIALSFTEGKAKAGNGIRTIIVGAKSAAGKVGKGMSFTGKVKGATRNSGSFVEPNWTSDIPLFVRAMVKSGDSLFLLGPPDIMDESKTFQRIKERDPTVQKLLSDQDAALHGKQGGILRVVSAKTGKTTIDIKVNALPTWDGMAAANNRLFFSTTDGRVVCFGKAKK
jgi:outer membrane protein assembly factor BamB